MRPIADLARCECGGPARVRHRRRGWRERCAWGKLRRFHRVRVHGRLSYLRLALIL